MLVRERTYICIDLKSFYASVECMERGLDPLKTNLVVADESRTDKTICLAVSPSLKSYGIPGRERLYILKQKVKEANENRKTKAPNRTFTGASFDDTQLKQHPEYSIDFIVAPPQMAKYIQYSTKIYDVYLKYISAEDIHVYSIDEVFMDVTGYLNPMGLTAEELARKMINDVLKETGVTATAGIGTNMYLAKVAMDIVAKKMPPDKNGVRIASLDELSYRRSLWEHTPLTDFWRVGHGIQNRLQKIGLYTMGDICRCSEENEDLLYQTFGINAELLIDHAWGYEPTTIKDIKAYKPSTNSLSSGQVLHCAYTSKKAKLIVKEMMDLLALDLVDKDLVTDQLVLTIGYDIDNLTNPDIADNYKGEVVLDHYGRKTPKPAHGTSRFDYTSSSTKLVNEVSKLYDRIINPILLVRRITISVNNIVPEGSQPTKKQEYKQIDLFSNVKEDIEKEKKEKIADKKEKNLQKALLEIKQKYGKNAVLKGMNLEEGATAKDRNAQIGGHKA